MALIQHNRAKIAANIAKLSQLGRFTRSFPAVSRIYWGEIQIFAGGDVAGGEGEADGAGGETQSDVAGGEGEAAGVAVVASSATSTSET